MVTKHIRRRLETADSDALACYFFKSGLGNSVEPAAFLRSLIAQLCKRERTLPVIVQKLFSQYSTGDKQPDSFFLADVLISLIRRYRQTFILIDALDEASDIEGALEIIRYLVETKLANLHLLVSSRLQINIKEKLEAFITSTLSMEDHAVDDLSFHIQKRFQEDPRLKSWDDPLKRKIEVSLIRRAITR